MSREMSGSVDASGASREVSRRDFLAGGLALGAGFAGHRFLGSAPKLEEAAAGASVAGTINFLSWVAYDLRFPQMNSWRAKNGIKMNSTYIDDYPEIPAKLTSPATRGLYNLATYGAQYGRFWKELGILSPLDMSKIPNYKNSLSFFNSGPTWANDWHFDGEQWGIPFTWSYSANNYNAAKIKAPTSMTDFLKPEFHKKFALNDDYQGEILLAAEVLKFANQKALFTPHQLSQIVDFLLELKKNALLVAESNGDIANLFASGEIVACIDGFLGMQELVAQKGVTTIESVVASEGSFSFVDSYFIPAGAKDTDSVYAFINEALAPPMQAQESGYLQAGVTTKKGVAALSASDRKLYQPSNVQALFKSAPLFDLPTSPPKGYVSIADWETAWESVKA
jgi:spermidine/putrescine transport system substrate-binding protein